MGVVNIPRKIPPSTPKIAREAGGLIWRPIKKKPLKSRAFAGWWMLVEFIWWRRRELNPRPSVLCHRLYMLSTIY